MAKEILPFQKKLSLTFFSFIFLVLLVYLSQNLDLNEKSPVEQETIEFRDALAKSIIDQTDLGIKENIESIKPEN